MLKAEHKKIAETAEVARKRSIDAEISSKSSVTGEGSTSGTKQLKITTICSKTQTSEVNKSVGVSFNIVNNKHFRKMCHKIGEEAYGSSYQVPSDYLICTTLLEKEYSNVSERCSVCCETYM